MVGIIKQSGVSPVLTFHLFNLSCVGEVVQLNFLLLGRDCIFSLLYQGLSRFCQVLT